MEKQNFIETFGETRKFEHEDVYAKDCIV